MPYICLDCHEIYRTKLSRYYPASDVVEIDELIVPIILTLISEELSFL